MALSVSKLPFVVNAAVLPLLKEDDLRHENVESFFVQSMDALSNHRSFQLE